MIKWINKKRNKKGFTLIELIVVIAILGILAAIAIPRFGGFTKKANIAADEQYGALVGNAVSVLIASGDIVQTKSDDAVEITVTGTAADGVITKYELTKNASEAVTGTLKKNIEELVAAQPLKEYKKGIIVTIEPTGQKTTVVLP